MKKEIIKNDKKWLFIEQENGNYAIEYQEYHKSCNEWVKISKDKNYTKETIIEIQKEMLGDEK